MENPSKGPEVTWWGNVLLNLQMDFKTESGTSLNMSSSEMTKKITIDLLGLTADKDYLWIGSARV